VSSPWEPSKPEKKNIFISHYLNVASSTNPHPHFLFSLNIFLFSLQMYKLQPGNI
jgi:hypothetical protein